MTCQQLTQIEQSAKACLMEEIVSIAPIKSMGAFLLYGNSIIRGKEVKKENDELIGLVLEDNEKSELYKLCKQNKIQVPCKSLFQDDVNYHLWCFSKKRNWISRHLSH